MLYTVTFAHVGALGAKPATTYMVFSRIAGKAVHNIYFKFTSYEFSKK